MNQLPTEFYARIGSSQMKREYSPAFFKANTK